MFNDNFFAFWYLLYCTNKHKLSDILLFDSGMF